MTFVDVTNDAVAVPRPLPEVTPMNTWFWTSGEHDVLRIQGCGDCGKLVHPPVPICPRCRSANRVIKDTSGIAVIVGLTVNAQMWHPAFPPPYVIAIVALAEDYGVRLTTNIVGCETSDVKVGQEVTVVFEQHDDVWLPLFTPTGSTELIDAVAEPRFPSARTPHSSERFEHKSVISGIGRSAIGRRLHRDPLSLTMDACLAAIADAGLSVGDIDGLSTYPASAVMGIGEGGVTAVEEALWIRPTWHNGGGDLPGPGGSVIAGMLAVAAGLCKHVLCFRTVWESTYRDWHKLGGGGMTGGGGRVTGPLQEFRLPFGALSAANWIAINASQYMHRYGATRELLGAIAVTARTNAAHNPMAIYRDPMTMEDYLNARMITTPFGLYDCDVPCDASIAVIVSDASVASDLPHPAVRVNAVGTQITERVSRDQGTLTHLPQVFGPSAHLWTRTELTPADIDLALLYDGFTFNAVSWLEALGFCELGGAQDYIAGGTTIALDGALPLNPHGGQLSEGRTHGYGLIHEAVLQLRHEAGGRQVKAAGTAVVTSGGGSPACVLLLQR